MLKKKQKKALELMLAGEISQKEIAAQIGVTEQTIVNWKKNEEFINEFNDALRNNINTAAGKAFKRELELLKKADSDSVSLSAAKDILDRAGFKAGDWKDRSEFFNKDDGFIKALESKAGELNWEE